jgi:hypothetical protein
MTELEKIKQELTTLTERVNSVTTLTNGSIHLTHEQLKKLMIAVQEETIEMMKSIVDSISLNIEDNIELSINYGREISIDIDEDDIKNNIKSEFVSNLTDEDVESYLDDLNSFINSFD